MAPGSGAVCVLCCRISCVDVQNTCPAFSRTFQTLWWCRCRPPWFLLTLHMPRLQRHSHIPLNATKQWYFHLLSQKLYTELSIQVDHVHENKNSLVTSQFSLLSLLPFSSSLRMKEASMDNNNLHLIGKYIYRVDSVEHINTENNFIASLLQLQADNNNTTAYLLTFADMDEEMRWKKLCVLRRVCGSHRHLAFWFAEQASPWYQMRRISSCKMSKWDEAEILSRSASHHCFSSSTGGEEGEITGTKYAIITLQLGRSVMMETERRQLGAQG